MSHDAARVAWNAVQQIDLLAAAWQLTEHQMEQILQVPEDTLARWRHSDSSASWSDEIATRLQSLQRLQYGLWLRQPPGQYAAIWRRPWTGGSPIGARTLVDTIITDGQAAIEKITEFLIAG